MSFAERLPQGPVPPVSDDGWPDDFAWPESVRIDVYDMADPEQRAPFQHALGGSIHARACKELGSGAARIETAPFAIHLNGELEDPADLAYLQAVQAILRCLARDCGALAALNETSIAWLDLAKLANAAPSPTFQLSDWLGIVLETEADPRFGRVLHTRGMAQFGRPDLLMVGFDEDVASAAAEAVSSAAAALAKGAVLGEGDRFLVARLSGGRPCGGEDRAEVIANVFLPDENGPDVGLNNDGLILRCDPGVLRQLEAALRQVDDEPG